MMGKGQVSRRIDKSLIDTGIGEESDDQDADIVQSVVAPDGGWGWMVVLASFLIHVIADGIVYSFGVLLMEFVDYFRCSRAAAAWIGALQPGITFTIGPLASVLTNRYGCRRVTVAGSLLAGGGLIVSVWAPNLYVLYLTCGVLAGAGFGLIYLPAIVCVSQYFDKRRSLATGLAVCGSGFGTFLLAPLTGLLVEHFSWQGALLVLGGLTLNVAVCGLLFRPLRVVRVKKSWTPSTLLEENSGDWSSQVEYDRLMVKESLAVSETKVTVRQKCLDREQVRLIANEDCDLKRMGLLGAIRTRQAQIQQSDTRESTRIMLLDNNVVNHNKNHNPSDVPNRPQSSLVAGDIDPNQPGTQSSRPNHQPQQAPQQPGLETNGARNAVLRPTTSSGRDQTAILRFTAFDGRETDPEVDPASETELDEPTSESDTQDYRTNSSEYTESQPSSTSAAYTTTNSTSDSWSRLDTSETIIKIEINNYSEGPCCRRVSGKNQSPTVQLHNSKSLIKPRGQIQPASENHRRAAFVGELNGVLESPGVDSSKSDRDNTIKPTVNRVLGGKILLRPFCIVQNNREPQQSDSTLSKDSQSEFFHSLSGPRDPPDRHSVASDAFSLRGRSDALFPKKTLRATRSDSVLHCPPRPARRVRSYTWSDCSTTTITPFSRKDILYSGSLLNIPLYRKHPETYAALVTISPREELSDIDEAGSSRCCRWCSELNRGMTDMLSCRLLRSPVFLLFAISNFLTSLGFSVPFIFLPDRAKLAGVDEERAAWLLAIIGIANTLGRVVFGCLSDRPWVNRLTLYSTALTLCGLATALSVLCGGNYLLLASYAAFFGTFIGVCVSLTSVVLVDLFGLEFLTGSFGLLLLFQGAATFVGPPMAGWLYDWTGSYSTPFILTGSLVSLSGAMLYFLPLVERHCARADHKLYNSQDMQLGKRPVTMDDKDRMSSDMLSLGSLMLESSHSWPRS